jgi:hypothetical protein
MPWQECSKMDERLRFVARLLEGEKMAVLCREFDISRKTGDLEYPFHDRTITVTNCGRICIGRRKINLSIVFAGQNVGIKEVSDKVWLVSFMQYDLGFFDQETGWITSAENPFGAKVFAGSMGRRNTSAKNIRRRLPVQGLSRSCI